MPTIRLVGTPAKQAVKEVVEFAFHLGPSRLLVQPMPQQLPEVDDVVQQVRCAAHRRDEVVDGFQRDRRRRGLLLRLKAMEDPLESDDKPLWSLASIPERVGRRYGVDGFPKRRQQSPAGDGGGDERLVRALRPQAAQARLGQAIPGRAVRLVVPESLGVVLDDAYVGGEGERVVAQQGLPLAPLPFMQPARGPVEPSPTPVG